MIAEDSVNDFLRFERERAGQALGEADEKLRQATARLAEAAQHSGALERALQTSQANLRALLDGTSEAVVLLDVDLRVQAFNDLASALAWDFVGMHLRPGAQIGDAFRTAFGEQAFARLSLALAGERFAAGVELKDQNRKRSFEVSYNPVRSEDALLGVALTVRDSTKHRATEQQLLEAQKMESVGRLAGGIAHDFNNLLSAILGYGQLAARALDDDSDARGDINEVISAANRARILTRQLLTFARRQVVDPQDVDLNELIRDMEKLLRRLIGDDIDLVCTLADYPVAVHVDPGQFEQVIINLAVNARDAMPASGKLAITSITQTFAPDVDSTIDLSPGEYAVILVSDTGTGMAPAILEQIFEPFFTTKEIGKGTGLGLATCYGIIKQARGHIRVESEPGRGTTFVVYLPLADGAGASARGRMADQQDGPGGSDLILLVEDHDQVRALAERVLKSHGYRVLSAPGPVRAIEIAGAERGIDLIISDIVMPVMDGTALVEVLHGILGPRPVLLMSGYAPGSVAERLIGRPGVDFLQKPVTPAELLTRVRSALTQWRERPGGGL